MIEMLLPLQGDRNMHTNTQGGALGYKQVALSGRTSETSIRQLQYLRHCSAQDYV